MRHNYIRNVAEREAMLQHAKTHGVPVDETITITHKRDWLRGVGFVILPIAALLLILRLPPWAMLAGGWGMLALTSAWLWLLVSNVHHTQVRERAQTLETLAAFKDMLAGPHDTNVESIVRRLRDLERDHVQLVEVVNECVTWDHVPGGKPEEDAA